MCRSSGLTFDKQHCKFVEKSSNSSSDGESSSSNYDTSSSSSGDDGSSSSSDDGGEGDDDEDSGECFSNYIDALMSNLSRRSECKELGGDISSMEVVLHLENKLWCLVGSCDVPSSSSSSDGGLSSSSSDNIVCKEIPGRVNNGEMGYLSCPGSKISEITFASYGVPVVNPDYCSYSIGGCHDPTSKSVVESFCLWREYCNFTIAPGPIFGGDFGYDPCVNVVKFFVVSWKCGDSSSSYSVSSSSSSVINSSSSSFVSSSSSSVVSSSSSSSVSSSSSFVVSSSSSYIGVSSSSSVQSVYEFCKENPTHSFCTGQDGSENSSSSKSAVASSSSQGTPAKHNERGPNAVYTADDIFSSGLDNMEPRKCYSLNPDRGTQYGWINNDAQDRWWWVERPCDGSAPVEPVTPNGCKNNKRGANAVYTIDDCFSSGLDNMEPGKCYSLNPDRWTQYGWINNDARDRWWWIEVQCGLIYFPKRYVSESNSDYMQHDEIKLFYDAAGRKTTLNPEIRRFLFSPKKALDKEQKSK